MEEEYLYSPTPEEAEKNWKTFDAQRVKENNRTIEEKKEEVLNDELDQMWFLKMDMKQRAEDARKLQLEIARREEIKRVRAEEKRRSAEKFWEIVMAVIFLFILMVVLGVCNLFFRSSGLPAPR